MFSIAIAAGTQYYEFLASPLGSLAFVKFGAEVVVLAAVSPSQGAIVLRPDRPVANGTQVV